MKTFRLYITLALLFLSLGMKAQTFTLQGKVSDKDGHPIELASVSVLDQGKLVMTNLHGEFHIELQSEDSVKVVFAMVGYRTKTRILRHPRGKQTLQVQLADDNLLNEVVVEGKTPQHGTTQQLDVKDMKTAPSATGNAVEEMIQSQAGVSTHSELSSQYNVRGGSFDENSV